MHVTEVTGLVLVIGSADSAELDVNFQVRAQFAVSLHWN
jgi:hypothetical protein